MSIIFENSGGWLLCHKRFLQKTYSTVKCLPQKIRIKDSYFDIRTPILMDSAAKKVARLDDLSKSKVKKKKKKKKSKIDIDNGSYHSLVKPIIEELTSTIVKVGKDLKLFEDSVPSPEEWLSNNFTARNAARSVSFNTELLSLSESCLFHEHVKNEAVIKTFRNKTYILPPHCSFLLCDIKYLNRLIGVTYDVIVMDPPWQNKSVKRKGGYAQIDCSNLLTLPICELTQPGSLIVVWATNNEKQLTFIKKKLFPHWGIDYCADWHWVKVTQRGVYIHSIESTQNKPYENLILGRCSGRRDGDIDLPSIEAHKVLVSVPSSIHSHKPPLTEILKPYLPENANCLELFARYLLPGWTSCGNEVLKLQALSMFDDHETEGS